eukprot:jgi/Ulvmu1/3951/UM018_0174.1
MAMHQVVAKSASSELQRLGAQVTPVHLPAEVHGYFESTQVLMSRGLAAAHSADFHAYADRMSPQLQAIFRDGLAVTPDALASARAAQHSTRRFCCSLFEPPPNPASATGAGAVPEPLTVPATAAAADVRASRGGRYHAALSLAVLGVAPPSAEGTGSPRPASLWSLGGVPAMAVPWGQSPDGLPLAVQLSAAHGADWHLLRIAAMVHEPHIRDTNEAIAMM